MGFQATKQFQTRRRQSDIQKEDDARSPRYWRFALVKISPEVIKTWAEVIVAWAAAAAVIGGVVRSISKKSNERKCREQEIDAKLESIQEMLEAMSTGWNATAANVKMLVAIGDTPIWEADAVGGILDVNPAFEELVGRSAQELLGMGWENVIHPDDRTQATHAWDKAVNEHKSYSARYRVYSARAKGWVVARSYAQERKDSQGKCVGYVGVTEVLDEAVV